MLLEICSFPDELTTILFLSSPSRYVTPLHSAHLDLLVPSNSLSGLQKFSPGARCKSDLLARPTLSTVLVLLALSSTSSTQICINSSTLSERFSNSPVLSLGRGVTSVRPGL